MSLYLPHQSFAILKEGDGDTLKGAAIACVLFVSRSGGGGEGDVVPCIRIRC